MSPPDRTDQLKRLARIRGQIDGIARMLDEDRPETDVLVQLRAVRAALGKVEEGLLRAHAARCVAAALRSEGKAEAAARLEEFFEVLARFGLR